MNFIFFFNSILLGVGLAMDAFSVSLANGLHEPLMKKRKMAVVAATFALFQFLMPLLGYFCVSTIADVFNAFQKFIPYIALALLAFIGVKMIIDGTKPKCDVSGCRTLKFSAIIVQGIATSIDALSVGFTIATYTVIQAVLSCLVIGVVTFLICLAGVIIGQKIGDKLSGKAEIFGGVILIIIGLEIFITSFI